MIFFADESISPRCARVIEENGDSLVLHCERFQPGTPDTEWIRVAGEAGWTVVTVDGCIFKTPLERAALEDAGVPVVLLPSCFARWGFDEQLEWLTKRWKRISATARNTTDLLVVKVPREGRPTVQRR
ncbi:MAG: DUF5615 family PIN-like protein [Acidobacteriota bacterium]